MILNIVSGFIITQNIAIKNMIAKINMNCDPVIDQNAFSLQDWTSIEFGHIQGKEELPPNMPQPRGFGFVIHAMADADHASDLTLRRLRTGFLVYLNSSLTHWFSKKKGSVESSEQA